MGKCISKLDKRTQNNTEENKEIPETLQPSQPEVSSPVPKNTPISGNTITVIKPNEEQTSYQITFPTDLHHKKEVNKYIESVIGLNLLGQGANPSLNFEYIIFRELAKSQDIKSTHSFLKAFYSFLKDEARAILNTNDIDQKDLQKVELLDLIQREGKQIKTKLDPFLDRIWRRAISYSIGYYYLSNLMVGRCLDRMPILEEPVNTKYINKIWSRYNKTVATLEENYMVWVKPSEYNMMLEILIKYIINRPKKFTQYKVIPLKYIIKVLDKTKRFLKAKKNSRFTSLKIQCFPTECEIFNISKEDVPIEDTFNRISLKLAQTLTIDTLMREYNLSTRLADEYYKEYIKYLVLEYYTTTRLIPSDQVEQVWNLHQSFTKDYRDFCIAIYGKLWVHLPVFIHESHMVKNFQMYENTMELYEFIFKEKPPLMIWPTPEEKFSTEYTELSWVSILRMFALLVGFYRNKLINENTTLEFIMQMVEDGYLIWPDNDASSFEFLKREKHSLIHSITRKKFWTRKDSSDTKNTFPGDINQIIKTQEESHKSPAQVVTGSGFIQEVEGNSPRSLTQSPDSQSGLEQYGLGENDFIDITSPKKELNAAQRNEMKDKLSEETKEATK